MTTISLKVLTTHITEGAALITEYWMIGLIHPIARHTVYYNGNVNTLEAGYFVAIVFSLFYFGRILGNLFSLRYAKRRSHVLFTYCTFVPLVLITFFQGFFTGALWIFVTRIVAGFLSGYGPMMSKIRIEEQKINFLTILIKAAEDPNCRFRGRIIAKMRIAVLPLIWTSLLEFTFCYGALWLASCLYKVELQSVNLPGQIFAYMFLAILILIGVTFKFRELIVS